MDGICKGCGPVRCFLRVLLWVVSWILTGVGPLPYELRDELEKGCKDKRGVP